MEHYSAESPDAQGPSQVQRPTTSPKRSARRSDERPGPGVVEAVDRALQLLVALADAGPTGAALSELATAAEVNKSTAYRALATLRARGFALQDGDGALYRLGPAAYELGERSAAPGNLARALHPALVALCRASAELVHLGVLVGDQVRYIDKVEPDRAIRVWSVVGQQAPIATTAMGRALLAARDADEGLLGGYVRNLPGGRRTSLARLQEAVAHAKVSGYAVEVEENEPDVACVGAAILRGGWPVAAVSITALAARMTPRRQAELAELIAREVGTRLPSGFVLPAILTEERHADEA